MPGKVAPWLPIVVMQRNYDSHGSGRSPNYVGKCATGGAPLRGSKPREALAKLLCSTHAGHATASKAPERGRLVPSRGVTLVFFKLRT